MSSGCEVRAATFGGRIADRSVGAVLNAATFVAGQPVAYDSNGYKAATVAGGTGVTDVFAILEEGWNAINLEGFGGAVKVQGTVVGTTTKLINALKGPLRLNLKGEDVNGTTVYSFLQTPTSGAWAIGAKVYLPAGAGTKWDDTAVASEASYGKVASFTGPATLVESIEIDFTCIG